MKVYGLQMILLTLVACFGGGRTAQALDDVLDFSTIAGATPNDPMADNTAALIDALEERTSTNERMVIYFPSGDWHFSGELPVNSSSNPDPSIFDNVTLVGAPAAMTAQHQESGVAKRLRRTRFLIDLESDSDIWWDQERTLIFGPLTFKDIAFQVVDDGSLFDLGTPADGLLESFRGLHFERCIFSKKEHYSAVDIGDGRPWLVNAGADGWVLNNSNTAFAIRLWRAYDTNIQNCSIRGFRYGIIDNKSDRLRVDNLHAMSVGKAVDTLPVGSIAAVGAHYDDIFIEDQALCGGVFHGQVDDIRCEGGFDGHRTGRGVPVIGPRPLPASVGWSFDTAFNTNTITFTFTGSYDCTDYFEPRSVIRITPSDENEPVRYLYITAVAANSVTFDEASSKCYVGRNISGTGTGVTRFFGNSAILVGDRASLMNPSFGVNVNKADHPELFVVPRSKPIKVGGMTEGRLANTEVMSSNAVVVASSVGTKFNLQGGVDWLGSANVPKHPLVNPGGIGPATDGSSRDAEYDPVHEVYCFRPGRGVGTHSGSGNAARNLTFHWWADPENFSGVNAKLTIDGSVLTPTLTQLEIPDSARVENHYAGRGIEFLSGPLAGLVADITSSQTVGSNTRLTIRGLPTGATPAANGNQVAILGLPDACYRPYDDADGGWIALKLRRPLNSNEEIKYRFRAYSPDSSGSTITLYAGGSLMTPHTLDQGWKWYTGVITDAQQAAWSDGINMIRIKGTGNGYVRELIADFEVATP